MKVPDGFVPVGGMAADGFARPEAAEAIRHELVRWGSLARAGAHAADTLRLQGRGAVYAVPAPDGGRWVIRRYRRGGWMAPLLGDRYLRRGPGRPLVETRASEAARARGIATPRVVAGVVYPSGAFYRADLVTEWVPDAQDLASLLFPADGGSAAGAPYDPRALLAGAGMLAVRLARAGIRHRDLNAKNVLVAPPGAEPDARFLVLDLDRATVHAPGSLDVRPMGARLERSLRKFERGMGRQVPDDAWHALTSALATEPDPR